MNLAGCGPLHRQRSAARGGLVAVGFLALSLAAQLALPCTATGCAVWLTGCARTEDSARPVDPALLAWLSRARSAHHRADLLERDGRGAAIGELERLLAAPRPPETPELRETVADTLARLADLRSQEGDVDAADRELDKALPLAPHPTYLRGHLLEVRGLVAERRALRLAAAGDRARAEAARAAALAAFEASMAVQDEVIRSRTRPRTGADSIER